MLIFLREKYCELADGSWFVMRKKHCQLVADKSDEQRESYGYLPARLHPNWLRIIIDGKNTSSGSRWFGIFGRRQGQVNLGI
jgi:hypothetical protein